MANFKRHRSRSRCHTKARTDRARQDDLKRRLGKYADYLWLAHWPQWWDLVFHRRPHRAATKNLLRKIATGNIDAENASWPLERKPHKYYW